MSRFTFFAYLLLQVVCTNAFALELYKPSYETGLKDIYLLHSPDYVGAEFYLFVNVGEADMEGPEGLSHFLEHLALFSALEKDRGELSISVDENAFAYSLATVFYAYGEAHKDLEAILKRFNGLFQPIELDRAFMGEERTIVEREFQIRAQNNLLIQDENDVLNSLFASRHLGRSVLGNAESIRALSIDDALVAHDKFYLPSNATLYIIGNFNHSNVAKHIKSIFPKSNKKHHHTRHFELNDIRVQDEVNRQDIFRDRLIFKKAINIPAQYSWAERMVLRDHLHDVLSSSYPSGLRKALQYDAFWAADMKIELEFASADILLLHIDAAPDFGVELNDLAAELENQLELIAENGVSRMTFYDLKEATEFFYEDLKNSPTDLHEYVYNSLLLNAEPPTGDLIHKAARKLTHLDFDVMMQAVVAPSNTSIRFLRAKN